MDRFGFNSVEELEEALRYAYQLGINPLPKLRKALTDAELDEWSVVYWTGHDGEPDENMILVRVFWDTETGVPEDVSVEQGYYNPNPTPRREVTTNEVTTNEEEVDFIPED